MPADRVKEIGRIWLHAGGLTCAASYGALAWLARPSAEPPLHLFLAAMAVAAVPAFVLFWRFGRTTAPLPVAAMVGWAVVFRLCGLVGGPIYEDDYFRYLWDGFRFATTGSPYGASPEDFFDDPSVPDTFQDVLSGVNNPDLPTIYGPTTQGIFALSYWLRPASVGALQLVLILVDLGIVALLARLAPARNVLLYAWCPLVVKEVAFTAHPDGIGVALLLAAIVLAKGRRWPSAAVCLGLACGAKIFALVVAPFVLARSKARHWAVWIATLAGVYAPFALTGGTDVESLRVFAREWEFNSALYGPVSAVAGPLGARLVLAAAACGLALRYYLKCARGEGEYPPRGDLLYGALLVVSPVINAWYLLWLLPFAAIYPSLWAWTASVTLSLSYVTGLNLEDASLQPYGQPAWARALEFGAVLAAAGIGAWRGRVRRAHGPRCTGS